MTRMKQKAIEDLTISNEALTLSNRKAIEEIRRLNEQVLRLTAELETARKPKPIAKARAECYEIVLEDFTRQHEFATQVIQMLTHVANQVNEIAAREKSGVTVK